MSDASSASVDLLNANQRRHFEVLLSMLEDELVMIERVAAGRGAEAGVLTVEEDDLPGGFAAAVQPLIADVRLAIRELAAKLRLRPRRVSRRRVVSAAITAAEVRIDDSSPREMRGYGEVDPRLEGELMPALTALQASLGRMKGLLRAPRAGRHAAREG